MRFGARLAARLGASDGLSVHVTAETTTDFAVDFARDVDLTDQKIETEAAGEFFFYATPRPIEPKFGLEARLVIDSQVLGYWGFDEANVGDPALDETAYARNLTVSDASSVIPARLGNGRQMNGTTSRAFLTNAAHNEVFRRGSSEDLTIIGWVTLDSVLQTGSKRRTMIAFEGPTDAVEDRCLYRISVTNDGALRYQHQDDLGNWSELATAAGTIRPGRYYSLALTRKTVSTIVDGDAAPVNTSKLTLYLNNNLVPWVVATYNGLTTSEDLIPVPAGFSTAAKLCVGYSAKLTDATWHGIVDELSIHGTVRAKQPYLDSVYYRLTLPTAFTKLTTYGDIRTLGSVEMGGGTRWWCYERAGSVYVIRENSLGLYSREVMLATGGASPTDATQTVSWLTPGGVEQPRLAYDPVTDTLVIVFIGGGRVYKVAAASGDSPPTLNMPATGSTTTVVKTNDVVEVVRASMGQTQGGVDEVGVKRNGDAGLSGWVTFFEEPTFGLVVTGTNPYGYAVVRSVSGDEDIVARLTVKQTARNGDYYFLPIADGERMAYATYYALPILRDGSISRSQSNIATDFKGDVGFPPTNLTSMSWNKHGDVQVEVLRGALGGTVPHTADILQFTTRAPIKIPLGDAIAATAGGTTFEPNFSGVTRTPIKVPLMESMIGTMGGTLLLTIRGPRGEVNL